MDQFNCGGYEIVRILLGTRVYMILCRLASKRRPFEKRSSFWQPVGFYTAENGEAPRVRQDSDVSEQSNCKQS